MHLTIRWYKRNTYEDQPNPLHPETKEVHTAASTDADVPVESTHPSACARCRNCIWLATAALRSQTCVANSCSPAAGAYSSTSAIMRVSLNLSSFMVGDRSRVWKSTSGGSGARSSASALSCMCTAGGGEVLCKGDGYGCGWNAVCTNPLLWGILHAVVCGALCGGVEDSKVA